MEKNAYEKAGMEKVILPARTKINRAHAPEGWDPVEANNNAVAQGGSTPGTYFVLGDDKEPTRGYNCDEGNAKYSNSMGKGKSRRSEYELTRALVAYKGPLPERGEEVVFLPETLKKGDLKRTQHKRIDLKGFEVVQNQGVSSDEASSRGSSKKNSPRSSPARSRSQSPR